jgi:epoxyqueuosine reductase
MTDSISKSNTVFSSDELNWINQRAQDVGFLETSTVSLKDDPNFQNYLKWVQNNHHKPLDYLGNHLDIRNNPKLLGDALESATIFLHPTPSEKPSKYIARYAWGKDYHHTIKAKLFSLSQDFQNTFGTLEEERVCVDTAPLLERSIAQRSGLGWIGKNGCLISRKHGSFFLIGSWLTSKKIEANEPKPGSFHCGTCQRCLQACPTDAFISPGFLDAQKCLSTQTIENRKLIEPTFHPKITHQAFGCDICQEVCPWNRKTLPIIQQEVLPSLETLLSCSEKEFRDHFRKTALERPGWAGLRRNFLILAAQNRSFPLQIIIDHLRHPHEVVRETAHSLLQAKKQSSIKNERDSST